MGADAKRVACLGADLLLAKSLRESLEAMEFIATDNQANRMR